jgi:hypothetical protein
MSGGISNEQPFRLNMKCLIFSSIMIGLYFIISSNPMYIMIPIIFIISYVAMAWYDVQYSCSDKLYSGIEGPVELLESIVNFIKSQIGLQDTTVSPKPVTKPIALSELTDLNPNDR